MAVPDRRIAEALHELQDAAEFSRSDKIIIILGFVMALATVAMVTIGGFSLPAALSANRNALSAAEASKQVERNTDIANCRAQARVEYDKALQLAADTKAIVDFTTNQGLAAALRGDDAAANEIATRAADERQAALDASHDASAVADEYQGRIRLAISDPDLFLQECHEIVSGGD